MFEDVVDVVVGGHEVFEADLENVLELLEPVVEHVMVDWAIVEDLLPVSAKAFGDA